MGRRWRKKSASRIGSRWRLSPKRRSRRSRRGFLFRRAPLHRSACKMEKSLSNERLLGRRGGRKSSTGGNGGSREGKRRRGPSRARAPRRPTLRTRRDGHKITRFVGTHSYFLTPAVRQVHILDPALSCSKLWVPVTSYQILLATGGELVLSKGHLISALPQVGS